jgi:hypothetical protein
VIYYSCLLVSKAFIGSTTTPTGDQDDTRADCGIPQGPLMRRSNASVDVRDILYVHTLLLLTHVSDVWQASIRKRQFKCSSKIEKYFDFYRLDAIWHSLGRPWIGNGTALRTSAEMTACHFHVALSSGLAYSLRMRRTYREYFWYLANIT